MLFKILISIIDLFFCFVAGYTCSKSKNKEVITGSLLLTLIFVMNIILLWQ